MVQISNSSEQILEQIVEGLKDKKAENIKVIDLRELEHAVSDYFVICSGNSNVHIGALSESVDKTLRENIKEKAWNIEGKENLEWVLMDYSSVVVHIFQSEIRDFYKLEELWADGKLLEV